MEKSKVTGGAIPCERNLRLLSSNPLPSRLGSLAILPFAGLVAVQRRQYTCLGTVPSGLRSDKSRLSAGWTAEAKGKRAACEQSSCLSALEDCVCLCVSDAVRRLLREVIWSVARLKREEIRRGNPARPKSVKHTAHDAVVGLKAQREPTFRCYCGISGLSCERRRRQANPSRHRGSQRAQRTTKEGSERAEGLVDPPRRNSRQFNSGTVRVLE